MTLYAIRNGYSITVILGEDLQHVKEEYLRLLGLSQESLEKHEGFFPGCYAAANVLGRCSRAEQWIPEDQEPTTEVTSTSITVRTLTHEPEPLGYYFGYGSDCAGRTKYIDLYFEPSYSIEQLDFLVEKGDIAITELKSGVAMTSHLDG